MTRPTLALAALLIAALAVACGSGDDQPQTSATLSLSPSAIANAGIATTSAALTPTPAPTPTPTAPADKPLYIALGDSLSYGNGVADRSRQSFVALVHDALGPDYGLLNLGIPGYTSSQLLNQGQLDTALAEIRKRKDDAIPGNEVAAVTLEIGGNDLLNLYFRLVIPGTCPSVNESLQRPQCVQALQDILDRYQPNLAATLQQLQEADATVPIFVATLYNPFSGNGSVVDQLGVLSLEGEPGTPFPEGLNDTIRAQAQASGVHLVDWYPLFVQKQPQYIAEDLIHPNATGYRVLADAVIAAMHDAGLP